MTMDYKDKLLHKRMAQAKTALRKVAAALRDYKDGKWLAHADQASGAADVMQDWMNQLEKEGMKK